jgi:hypothetical protein
VVFPPIEWVSKEGKSEKEREKRGKERNFALIFDPK